MESVMKKISERKFDADVHSEFVKFSKGIFDNKYLLNAKRQKDRWSIKTGAEYANFLVGKCLENVGGKINVKGVIVSTLNLKEGINLPIGNVKQFMGIKQLVIDGEADVSGLKKAMEKYPRAFFALSFSAGGNELKIKAKAPKSAKPAAAGEKEKGADFCSLKTSDESIVKDLFFDCPDFREIGIKHTLKINEIILPRGEKDPVKIRENSVRKGVIDRKINADGREMTKEYIFEA